MHKLPEHIPTVATFRGEHPENIYYGSVAVVDKRGKLLAHAGDMRTPMFTRSALKPFQAMPLIAQPQWGGSARQPRSVYFEPRWTG
jgi:L-asparaginase II